MNSGVLDCRYLNGKLSVPESDDSVFNYAVRTFLRCVFMKLDVLDPFYMTPGVCGEKPGSITLGYAGQALLNTLHVHGHGVHSACYQDRLGGHEVPCMGDAVAGKHFRTGAAHAHKVDPLSSCLLCGIEKGRVVDGSQHGLKKVRFMAMDDDIDVIFLEATHIYISPYGSRRTKEDIRYFRSDHGTAPAVCQCCSAALLCDILIMLVHPNGGPMH